MPGTNRRLQALKEGYNVAGVGVLVLASSGCAVISPSIGLSVFASTVVLEGLYLLVVPKSRWYDAKLSARYDSEVLARRDKLKAEIGPTLSPALMSRFSRLEMTRSQIGAQSIGEKNWFREVLRKLDYLMEKFLLFASKQVQFQTYLSSVLEESDPTANAAPSPTASPIRRTVRRDDNNGEVDENWIQATVGTIQKRYSDEIEGLETQMKKEENLHNQAVMEKRKDVLLRRRQYVSQIGDILSNLNHQLHLMEDTFGLINDEIRARSPEQVLSDIGDLVDQTDNLTETLQTVSPFEHMPVAAGGAKLYDVAGEK